MVRVDPPSPHRSSEVALRMQEDGKLKKPGISTALIAACIKAMNEIRPGERIDFSIRCDCLNNASEYIKRSLNKEDVREDHEDGSFTIRAGCTFAVVVPENGKWKVQAFYLKIEPNGFHSIHVETWALTRIGFVDGPIRDTPDRELIRILGLFSLI